MPVENSRQGVRGVFLVRPGGLTIKLVTPSDPTATGYQYGLHHLAFLVDDLDDAIQELRGSGARLIGQPQPGEMFDDELIAFMFGAGINFELVTTREWRSRIQLTDGDQATR